MTAADLAAMIARDLDLATLSVVLDQDRRDEALGGTSVLNRLRYKPGSSIVASVTTQTAAGESTGWIAAYRDAVKVDKTLSRAARSGYRAHPVAGLEGVVVGETAADRQLAGALADVRAHNPELLANAVVIRHNPHRRVIFRTAVQGSPVILKVSSPDSALTPSAGAARRLAADLLERAGAAVIRPVPCGDLPGAETLPWWGDGDLASLAASAGPAAAAADAAGRQLALLHRSAVTHIDAAYIDATYIDAAHAAPDGQHAREAHAAVRVINTVLPRESARATRVSEALRQTHNPGAATTLVHGDFSPDQVLVAAGNTPSGTIPRGEIPRADIRIIDFDRAGVDLPERDLGSFLATADLAGRPELGAALLSGYTAAGGSVTDRELHRMTAHAFLLRSVEPFRGLVPAWADRTAYALHRAEQELSQC